MGRGTAVFFINRYGPSTEKGKSPFQLWFEREPLLENLKIFGTEVFIHVPKERRRKWDRKSHHGYFVGYNENQKGYRVWLSGSNKIDISRNIVFKNESNTSIISVPSNPDTEIRSLMEHGAAKPDIVTRHSLNGSNENKLNLTLSKEHEQCVKLESDEEKYFETDQPPPNAEDHKDGGELGKTVHYRERLRSYKKKPGFCNDQRPNKHVRRVRIYKRMFRAQGVS